MSRLTNWLVWSDWAPILLVVVVVLLVAGLAVWAANQPTCEDLGGTMVQTGTRTERIQTGSVKVGQVSVPIYGGTREVGVYDCMGDR